MNCPPITSIKAVFTVISVLLAKIIVPFCTAMPANFGVLWSTSKVIPAGTKTMSSATGGRSIPQVLSSLHFNTYKNWDLMIARLLSMVTVKVF